MASLNREPAKERGGGRELSNAFRRCDSPHLTDEEVGDVSCPESYGLIAVKPGSSGGVRYPPSQAGVSQAQHNSCLLQLTVPFLASRPCLPSSEDRQQT